MPTHYREEWVKTANNYEGGLCVWINQNDAPNLKAINSDGVCFALTKQWLASYTGDVSERMKFVNSFRLLDKQGNVFRTYIPDEYITKQDQYMKMCQSNGKNLAALKSKFKNYKKKYPGEISEPFEEALIETVALYQKLFFGNTCLEYKVIRHDDFSFPENDEFMNAFSGAKKEHCFYLVSLFSSLKGAHVVGFEFCPDYAAGPYSHFIDANLGLFYFRGAFDNALNFFCKEVKIKCFYDISYNIVEIRKFGFSSSGSREAARAELEA